MMDEGMKLYFKESAESAIHSCEIMISQGRKAKAQEFFTTALYFYAKVPPTVFSYEFLEKVEQLRLKIYT